MGGRNLPPPQKTVDCITLRSFICVSFQQLTFKLGIFIGLNYKGISIKLCWRVFANWCQSKVEKTLEGSIVSHHSFFFSRGLDTRMTSSDLVIWRWQCICLGFRCCRVVPFLVTTHILRGRGVRRNFSCFLYNSSPDFPLCCLFHLRACPLRIPATADKTSKS